MVVSCAPRAGAPARPRSTAARHVPRVTSAARILAVGNIAFATGNAASAHIKIAPTQERLSIVGVTRQRIHPPRRRSARLDVQACSTTYQAVLFIFEKAT